MTRKKTTAEFAAHARKVHGDRYDYSLVDYESTQNKVKLLCKIHGAFEQTPANHLTGFGCLRCGQSNAGQYHKKNTASFIEESRAIHGDTYDYTKTIYKGAREKLTVICPKHGAFKQTAFVHLRSTPHEACLVCSYAHRGIRSQTEFDEFLARAAEVHGDIYDYSRARSTYRGMSKDIEITCRKHGVLKQTPTNHLKGEGCRRCGRQKVADAFRKSTANFVVDARRMHGLRYDYSQTEYRGAFENVTIICPIDGRFEQSPTSHLSGIGCPKCSRRDQGAPRNLMRALRGEFDDGKPSYVYIVTFRLPGIEQRLVKVGSGTGTRINTTLHSIKRVGGYELKAQQYDFKSSGEAIVFEQVAHQQIIEHRFVVPPEFKFAGHSEVFTHMPDLSLLDKSETILRFRSGERWVIRRVAKRRYI